MHKDLNILNVVSITKWYNCSFAVNLNIYTFFVELKYANLVFLWYMLSFFKINFASTSNR